MGVHATMCVTYNPIGIKQMLAFGFNVVLVRDLTDVMYDPEMPPFVSHDKAIELVIQHIERYLCPSISSRDLLSAYRDPWIQA
jgi:hypothetical protein